MFSTSYSYDSTKSMSRCHDLSVLWGLGRNRCRQESAVKSNVFFNCSSSCSFHDAHPRSSTFSSLGAHFRTGSGHSTQGRVHSSSCLSAYSSSCGSPGVYTCSCANSHSWAGSHDWPYAITTAYAPIHVQVHAHTHACSQTKALRNT